MKQTLYRSNVSTIESCLTSGAITQLKISIDTALTQTSRNSGRLVLETNDELVRQDGRDVVRSATYYALRDGLSAVVTSTRQKASEIGHLRITLASVDRRTKPVAEELVKLVNGLYISENTTCGPLGEYQRQ